MRKIAGIVLIIILDLCLCIGPLFGIARLVDTFISVSNGMGGIEGEGALISIYVVAIITNLVAIVVIPILFAKKLKVFNNKGEIVWRKIKWER